VPQEKLVTLRSVSKESRGRILVVEDEPRARAALRSLLSAKGFQAEVVGTPFKALGILSEFAPHVVITDVRMPGMDGIRFLQEVLQRRPETAVIVLTGFARVPDAVRAVKLGAETYLEKPIDVPLLLNVVDRAVVKSRHVAEMRKLWTQEQRGNSFSRVLGEHPSMHRVRQLIQKVAPTDATVLLDGEAGTGKSLVAAAIHELSHRSECPLVKLHCAAMEESHLESELFGHEPGSWAGALTRREGRCRQAHEGTLLLDEVSEIPRRTQVKLLRLLQDREFERLGGEETLTVDARLIATSHHDLRGAVQAGSFREDLYYKLDVVHIHLPSLRERTSDIPVMAAAMATRFARTHGKRIEGFSTEALELLQSHSWPGNVRELENVVERAVVLTTEAWVSPADVQPALEGQHETPTEAQIPGSTLAEIERQAILKTLEAVRGSTSKAARMLGISQRKIQYRLREYETTR
jgi:DNA-binding NtrC family response regulator